MKFRTATWISLRAKQHSITQLVFYAMMVMRIKGSIISHVAPTVPGASTRLVS